MYWAVADVLPQGVRSTSVDAEGALCFRRMQMVCGGGFSGKGGDRVGE